MPSNNLSEEWLPEPSVQDNTYARRAEHTLDWLARSTLPRAQACRRFLNENLVKLPREVQMAIRSAARNRWNSAFFELIVARILQELGAELEIEVPTASGKRPDYTAHFSDGDVVVEAIAPVFNANVGDEAKNRIPLLNYIEANIPLGWRVGIAQLPAIGPSQSRKEFERVVSALLNTLPSQIPAQNIELEDEISTGTIRLLAIPGRPGARQLLWEAPLTTIDNSEVRIRHAVKKKKQQVQQAGVPILLAIQASGLFSEREDFDRALYGHTFERYDEQRQLVEIGFDTNGVFTTNRNKPATYAGVLAFLEIGFLGGPAPILYWDPRFIASLPQSICQLEQRVFDFQANEIHSQPCKITDLMERVEFVQRGI